MKQPVRRAQVTYQKPSSINPVSVMVVLILGAIVYAAYCYWPVLRVKSNAKSEAQGYLVQYYRLNFRQDKRRNKDQATLDADFRKSLVDAGVTDPNLQIIVKMDPKQVNIDLTFVSQYELIGLDKRYPLEHKIHVETDAARIEW